MIEYSTHTLDNGLKVIIHQDSSTPIVAVNTLFDVGARDEDPNRTGFAHLFEHLMFGGSANIPDFDSPLQAVGGESNAFTSNDITNYYITLPKVNLETGFWLESDRMKQLAFTPRSLEVQQKVVIEEFKQRYLNQPYGDLWLLLRPLVYKEHPYQWATIGKEISHIENASMDDVKAFFAKHYIPNNANICIAGNIEVDSTLEEINKWYGNIPKGEKSNRNLPKEPTQKEARHLTIERDVPASMIYKCWRMCDRRHPDYPIYDLISDILGNGKSSRLYKKLLLEENLFTDIGSFISGSMDDGLFIITGRLKDNVDVEKADQAIAKVIDEFKSENIDNLELQKVKNRFESAIVFEDINVLDKAMRLSYFELLGDIDLINTEINQYTRISSSDIQRVSNQMFSPEQCSTLYYLKK